MLRWNLDEGCSLPGKRPWTAKIVWWSKRRQSWRNASCQLAIIVVIARSFMKTIHNHVVWGEDELYEILSQELSLRIMQYDPQVCGLAEGGTPDLSLISRFYIQHICDHCSSIHSGGHQPATTLRRQAFGSALDLLACPTTFSSYLNVSLDQDHRRCFALEVNFLSNSITDSQYISYTCGWI